MPDLTGKEQQFQHAYEVTGWGCRISRVRNIRSNMPTRYQVGVAGSHGLGTIDRTCLLCIRSGLQDLTGSKHQIERIYEVSHGFITTDHTCLRGIRTGLQIVHAYEISRPGCRVSRVRDPRSNIPKRYRDGTAGSHGFGPIDSTCLQGIIRSGNG